MGILNFYKWIKESYSPSFKKYYFDSYDHIYIDLNYLLHMSSYGTNSQDEIIERLSNMIESVLSHCIPNKTVNLFTDGSCSLAKLLLQRKRRLSSMRSSSSKSGKDGNKTLDDLVTSELNFTPGTKFMNELEKKMSNLIKKIEFVFKIKVNCVLDAEDEAEIKIKKALMDMKLLHPNDTHVVVTNDADVVVLLTTLDYVHNVFIFFKDPKTGMQFLSISELLWLHTKKYGKGKNYGLDFAFLSILMGNDYLPKINFLSLEKVWTSYKLNLNTYKSLIMDSDLNINKEFFCDILIDCMSQTKKYLVGKCEITDSGKKMYENYLDGLTWCLDVYYSGKCNRYNYMYEYADSPHPLALMLCMNRNEKLLKVNKIISLPIEKDLYTILLIPKSAKVLIDEKYYEFMDKHSILYDEEECDDCNGYYKIISKLNKELKQYDLDDCDDDDKNEKLKEHEKLAKKISNVSKNMCAHKKLHDPLCSADVENIVIEFNNYKKKLNVYNL